MNKQAILDSYIHDNKGVWQSSHENLVYTEKLGFFYSERITNYPINWFITEFAGRAKELGYINGYRWGVEYVTKGVKPDLPDDFIVCIDGDLSASGGDSVVGWNWGKIKSFRITDQRYKPADTSYLEDFATRYAHNKAAGINKELEEKFYAQLERAKDVSEIPESKSNAENVSDWYDYEAQKAVALPPVGEKVEVFLHWSESWSGWVVIVGHDHGGVIWRNGSDNKSYVYSPKDEIRPLDYNSKAEAEKKRVVDAALSVWIKQDNALDALTALYDAGFLRMPESKQ